MATFCDMALRPPVSRLSLTWDSDNKLRSADIDANGTAHYPVGGSATTPTFRHVYASYIDEPVVRKGLTSTGTVHFYHRNQQY